MQHADGFGSGRFNGVCHAQQASQVVIDNHKHHGLAFLAQALGAFAHRTYIHRELFE